MFDIQTWVFINMFSPEFVHTLLTNLELPQIMLSTNNEAPAVLEN